MANRLLAAALAVLNKRKEIVALPDFWDAVQRPDLRDVTEAAQLVGAPVLQSMLYEAKRVIAGRNKKFLELKDGSKVEVIKKADRPPAPLTQFLLHGNNYGDGRARYFERRPTKGWRWSIVDDAEAKAWMRQGVRLLNDLPGRGEIRKRRVA